MVIISLGMHLCYVIIILAFIVLYQDNQGLAVKKESRVSHWKLHIILSIE